MSTDPRLAARSASATPTAAQDTAAAAEAAAETASPPQLPSTSTPTAIPETAGVTTGDNTDSTQPATATVPPPPPPPPPPSPPAAVTDENPMATTQPQPQAQPQPQPQPPQAPSPSPSPLAPQPHKLRFCTVCAANQNRSMEAHARLAAAHYPVLSFGTGTLVRLPGPTITQPNIYAFDDVSYAAIHAELAAKNPRLYAKNGVLDMLARNERVKHGPERFQSWVPGRPRLEQVARGDQGSVGVEGGVVDVIITCEERCWDAVVDDLMGRGAPLNRAVHVVNVDIRDNHEEALVGSKAIMELAEGLNQAANEEMGKGGDEGWAQGKGVARASFDGKVPELLAKWQEKFPNLPALWTLSWL